MAQQAHNYTVRPGTACIVQSDSREEAMERALLLASEAVCTGSQKPCGLCRDCRKVREGVHPDVSIIARLTDDKGIPRRDITVEQVRQMSADAYIMPNEAVCRVFIVNGAEYLNIPAQNAALKLLEEPPGQAVFILCTQNASALLPTVRSRCSLISLNREAEADEELGALAREWLALTEKGDRGELFQWCTKNEGMTVRQAAALTECMRALLTDGLCKREKTGLTRGELVRLVGLTDKCAVYLRVNTGVKHIFGLLAVDSIEVRK